ncbi:OmpA family protein [Vibrio renipiscarius]|uniref:Membrane protein n=1 Tax=Vibrio renipiscarius TaxID=1461322 RepID=A0A0C2NHJ8_9VIBR|nr:OmpA family protein [Vibrio renipiscarius]KII75932.1 membrane protein [Vibrio renipiscarius]KII79036.1 membrane protein [Vibrio renipiscarius]
MRALTLSVLLFLTGCGSLPSDFLNNDMLSTAPQNEQQLMHPEWGKATTASRADVQGAYGVHSVTQSRRYSTRSQTTSLEHFLAQNNLNFEVLPGEYKMIKLVDTIKFNTGSSKVSQESAAWLDMIARYVASQPEIDVVIDGHADNTGAAQFNDQLSVKRADAVKQSLVKHQVDTRSVFTRGYGETEPVCNNATQSGKACNRRAEVVFILSTDY